MKRIAALAAILLLVALPLCACGDNDDEIEGTWVVKDTEGFATTLTFEDGKCTMKVTVEDGKEDTLAGTYTTEDKILTLSIGGEVQQYQYKIDDNELYLFSSITLKRVKESKE